MRFVLLIVSLLSPLLGAEELRIATFNLRNYLVMDRVVEDEWRPNYPKTEVEKAAIRQVILSVRPDLLLLQEIGPNPFLEELRSDLASLGLDYPFAEHFVAVDETRHLAVLSRFAPVEVVRHRDLEFKYFEGRELVKRGLLEVSFEGPEGTRFKVFNLHLKSRWVENISDPEALLRRTREAEACRNRIIERTIELGFDDYLIAGDFNDHPSSAPLRRFAQRGDLSITKRVPAADSRGEVWTYVYEKEGRYSTFDGFLASESLWSRVHGGVAHIYDGPGAREGSDHRMVFLDLSFD